MIKKVTLLLLLCSSLILAKEAILKLDTKGHQALIKDIIVTKSGDIISASDDKTIRVWDSTTGKEKFKILGEIGAGSEGMIYAIALSPNEEFLAVGGFLAEGHGVNDDLVGSIRIYNYQTKKLLHILKSHTNTVKDLAFIPDGNYLISGSADNTAKVWSVKEDFRLTDTIRSHSNAVYGVKIIKRANSYFAITAGLDNKISLYNLSKREEVASHALPYKLHSLSINPKKGHIAVCGFGREIRVYDYHLKLIQTIKSETNLIGLAFSPNGELLMAGTEGNPYPYINIYKTKNYTLHRSFKKHTNTTMAVAFLDNQRTVTGGGYNNEIYIWNVDTLKVEKKIVGVGSVVWSVGIKGDSVGFGNVDCGNINCSKLQKSINLKSFTVAPLKNQTSNFKRISTSYNGYTLSHAKGGDYGKSDAVLLLKKGGKIVAKITRGATDGYRHNCYGFYGNHIVSGGTNGQLAIYNLKGQKVAKLVGHTGEVWSIAIDGNRLVSGSSDQTIRVWDLSKLKREMRPMLNIFVSNDNEWVVWSKSGYYNASVEGAKYVGFHINQGADKEALFVSANQYPALYRPDIIDATLKYGSESRALTEVAKRSKITKIDVAQKLPPILTLYSKANLMTTKSRIEVNFNIESRSEIEKIVVTNNGAKIDTQRGLGRVGNEKSITIPLTVGKNRIVIRAKNRYAMSQPLEVMATRRGSKADIFKPTLYILGVGVTNYQISSYNLSYPDKDAEAIARVFKTQEGKLYKRVQAKLILNEEATRENILDGLSWIESEVTQKDMAILFFAGHGENDYKNNYYFLSHDGNREKLRRTALKWREIIDTIDNIAGKVIVMVDTCHSGNITGGGNRRGDVTSAIKSITDSGREVVVMSASTGRGYSIENDKWGHGAFTKAILDGVGSFKADLLNNNRISIKELDTYVTNKVKKLTNGEQKATTHIPDGIEEDFVIAVE